MSQTNTIYTSVAQVNDLLQTLGSDQRLSMAQKTLHAKFLAIFGGRHQVDQGILLWDCAEKAFNAMKNANVAVYGKFFLTRFGLTPRALLRKDYGDGAQGRQNISWDIKAFTEMVFDANKHFLDRWNERCQQLERTTQEIAQLRKEVEASLNANPLILGDMQNILKMMEEKGFVLKNIGEVNTRLPADILCKGITLKFGDNSGEQREVALYMPGAGNVMTEVHTPDGADCGTKGAEFAREIAACLQSSAEELGLPISYIPDTGCDPVCRPHDALPTPASIYPHLCPEKTHQ